MSKSFKIIIFLLLFLTFSTYSPSEKNSHKSFLFPINKLKVAKLETIKERDLLDELETMKGGSLLFVNHTQTKRILKKFDFIDTFELKKIYPDTIKITISEKTPIVIFFDGKKRYYLTDKGELIKYFKNVKLAELPLLIGKKKDFHKFYTKLKSINFPVNEIQSFNYFNIGRWDIILKNEKIVKLPDKNYIKALKNFSTLMKDKNFDKYKSFDYRINDQLILN